MTASTVRRPGHIKQPTDGSRRGIPWKTILFNCNCHTFDQVASQLTKAIRVSHDQGMAMASVVHNTGSAVVYVGHRERCEAVAMVLEAIGLRTKVAQ